MKNFLLCLLCLLCFATRINASADSILVKYDEIYVDHNSNIYCTTKEGIYKYSKNLVLQYSYEYNKYGAPSSIDAQIPMKVLLFFAQYNKVIVLDNRMSPIREIDFSKVSSDFNNAACFSADNNFWVFDNNAQSLTKYSQNFSVLFQYENMNLRMKQFIQAQRILEIKNYLLMSDTTNGYYIFDMLGNFTSHFKIDSKGPSQLWENQVFYVKDGHLTSIDIFDHTIVDLPILIDTSVKDFKISGTKVYLLYNNKLKVVERL